MGHKPIAEFREELKDFDGNVIVTVTTDDGEVVVINPLSRGLTAMGADHAKQFADILGHAATWAKKICYKGWRKDMETMKELSP